MGFWLSEIADNSIHLKTKDHVRLHSKNSSSKRIRSTRTLGNFCILKFFVIFLLSLHFEHVWKRKKEVNTSNKIAAQHIPTSSHIVLQVCVLCATRMDFSYSHKPAETWYVQSCSTTYRAIQQHQPDKAVATDIKNLGPLSFQLFVILEMFTVILITFYCC